MHKHLAFMEKLGYKNKMMKKVCRILILICMMWNVANMAHAASHALPSFHEDTVQITQSVCTHTHHTDKVAHHCDGCCYASALFIPCAPTLALFENISNDYAMVSDQILIPSFIHAIERPPRR